MDQYMIKGGVPLRGEVTISGAKNSALGILAAAALCEEPVTIKNVPEIKDIEVLLRAMEEIGARVDRSSDGHTVKINAGRVSPLAVDNEYIRKIRGSYYLIGALLGRFKKAQVVLPGGCDIGPRPIDQHIKGFMQLGAVVETKHGMVMAEAEKLVGNHIYLDMASVGATINIMLAATLAEGQTIIENPAKEPHVVDVANFLNSMGANIKGTGTDVIRITGVEKLHGSTYSIIPDQIEAGTFMVAAAATGGDVVIRNVIPKHLEAITAKLIEIGVGVEEADDAVRVFSNGRRGNTRLKTLPYPGFPTDMQPQMVALLTLSEGTSVITEGIFENRFKYVDELVRMGASIRVEGNTAVIDGVQGLTGATMSASDLRAGAALVIAGLTAEGVSIVENVSYIERGYENFEKKLAGLGAVVKKVDSEDERAMRKFRLKAV
ncbi:MAG: UDP-N-acetylglucosamine 1-carboxyvinyltransferase [Lachnospiraceae bacterium]|jgi:UDP-N-acetylglucosamine 1-carboxyvinyltransferase|nr:UDP-N-acetylglucosamine 1-carboxyvinyltransferase [Lachnospiraceae bacterium]